MMDLVVPRLGRGFFDNLFATSSSDNKYYPVSSTGVFMKAVVSRFRGMKTFLLRDWASFIEGHVIEYYRLLEKDREEFSFAFDSSFDYQRFFNLPIQSLPATEWWRLFIDFTRQDEGPLVFDDEHGFLKGCFSGLDFLLQLLAFSNRTQSFTPVTYQYMRDIIVEPISWVLEGDSPRDLFNFIRFAPSVFGFYRRSRDMGFCLRVEGANKNTTEAGLHEFMEDMSEYMQSYPFIRNIGFSYLDKDNRRCIKYLRFVLAEKGNFDDFIKFLYKKSSLGEMVQLVISFGYPGKILPTLFQEFWPKMTETGISSDKRLFYIADFVHKLEQRHIFTDGNNRVANLYLQLLLMHFGFKPSMLENPNILSMYATSEIVEEIKIGWKRFDELISTSQKEHLTDQDVPCLYLKGNKYVSHFLAGQLITKLKADYELSVPSVMLLKYLATALERFDSKGLGFSANQFGEVVGKTYAQLQKFGFMKPKLFRVIKTPMRYTFWRVLVPLDQIEWSARKIRSDRRIKQLGY